MRASAVTCHTGKEHRSWRRLDLDDEQERRAGGERITRGNEGSTGAGACRSFAMVSRPVLRLSPTKEHPNKKIDSKRLKISLQQSIYTEDLFLVV